MINKSNVAVPGCYPTSILIPIVPLLKNNLIKTDNLIIDSSIALISAVSRKICIIFKNNLFYSNCCLFLC